MSVAALNEFLLVSGPGLLLLNLLTFDYNLSGAKLIRRPKLALLQALSPLSATGSVPATGGSDPTARSHILPKFLDTRAQGKPGARCTRGLVCNV